MGHWMRYCVVSVNALMWLYIFSNVQCQLKKHADTEENICDILANVGCQHLRVTRLRKKQKAVVPEQHLSDSNSTM